MKTLMSILTDSFAIWSRNFTLMYVILLFSLLLTIILPEETPAWEWRWLLLALVLGLLLAVFLSGWFAMIAKACVRYLERPNDEPPGVNSVMEAFGLFKSFLPGIGQYFPSVALGLLIQGGLIFCLLMILQPLWQENMPLFERLTQPDIDPQSLVQSLSLAEQNSLTEFSLAVIGSAVVYGLFSLLTMLWPAFLILHEPNVLKAYGRSVAQFTRDPVRLIAISVLFLGAQMLLTLAMASSAFLVIMFCQFISLLLEIYMAVILFVYVYEVVGKPSLPLSDEPDNREPVEEPPAA